MPFRSADAPLSEQPIIYTCVHPECLNRTYERKPYCVEHMIHMPYARVVIRELEQRSAELKAAARPAGWRQVDLQGTRAQEFIEFLRRKGEVTLKSLKQEIAKDTLKEFGERDDGTDTAGDAERVLVSRGMDGYLKALLRAGMITIEERRTDHGMAKFVKLRCVVACGDDYDRRTSYGPRNGEVR